MKHKKFAKIFNSKKYGQIVVLRRNANDDSEIYLKIIYDASDLVGAPHYQITGLTASEDVGDVFDVAEFVTIDNIEACIDRIRKTVEKNIKKEKNK